MSDLHSHIELSTSASIPSRVAVQIDGAHKGFVVEQGDGSWRAFSPGLTLSSFIDVYSDKAIAVQAVVDA